MSWVDVKDCMMTYDLEFFSISFHISGKVQSQSNVDPEFGKIEYVVSIESCKKNKKSILKNCLCKCNCLSFDTICKHVAAFVNV